MLTALVLLAALAYAIHRLALGYPPAPSRYDHLDRREVAFLEAAAEALFPEGGAIPLAGSEAQIPRYMDRYLGTLHGGRGLQIRLLLTLIEQATIFFPAPGRLGRRRFTALDLDQRLAVLEGWAESRIAVRRLVFTALRAVLTMGYLGHPIAMRHLRLAPYDFQSPVLPPDLLYPPIGRPRAEIRYTEADRTAPSDGTPLDLDGPWHPDWVDRPL